jgi:hypothetical protein
MSYFLGFHPGGADTLPLFNLVFTPNSFLDEHYRYSAFQLSAQARLLIVES